MDPIFGEQGPLVTVHISVRGQVMFEADSTPIPGAMVSFGSGGYFSFAIVHDSAAADSSGRYEVAGTIEYHEGSCPFLWISARAEGYEVPSMEDSRLRVGCTSGEQQIRVRLKRRT